MIAIKDFKMPVDCSVCFARVMAWCRLDEEERTVVPALPDELPEGRPDWCPLVDVPDIHVVNCSEIPNSSDCVSRQAAIDIVNRYNQYHMVLKQRPMLGAAPIVIELEELPSVQPEQRYTKEELSVFKHGISLSLLSKRSSQHWRYDEDTATEIKFLERLYEKVVADMRGEQE